MGFFDTAEEKAEKRRKKAQEYLYSVVNRAHTDSTNLNYLQKAVSYGADVLAPMENGKTPFMNMFDFSDPQKTCLWSKETTARKLFIDHGAVFEGTQLQLLQVIRDCGSEDFALKLCGLLKKDEIGQDCQRMLFEAMYVFQDKYGDRPVLDKLTEFGMPLHEKNSKNGWTLLHCASYRDDGKHVKMYLDSGADSAAVNNDLKTPSQMTSGTISDYIRNYVRTDKLTVKKEEIKQVKPVEIIPSPADNGEWCLSMADEVAHVTERNKLGYRITQLFNFSARTFTQISTNLKTGGESQTMRTFDEFEDTSIIEQAIAEARKLKMDVSDSVLVKPMGKKDRIAAVR